MGGERDFSVGSGGGSSSGNIGGPEGGGDVRDYGNGDAGQTWQGAVENQRKPTTRNAQPVDSAPQQPTQKTNPEGGAPQLSSSGGPYLEQDWTKQRPEHDTNTGTPPSSEGNGGPTWDPTNTKAGGS